MQPLLVILHVLGASVWTGGHLVLAIGFLPPALRRRDPAILLGFESRFERIGIPALVLQILTGVLLALPHLSPAAVDAGAGAGGAADLDGRVGAWLIVKVVLLLATLGLALHARLRLVPRLGPETLRPLAAHILAITVLAVLFVVAGVAIRTPPGG